MEAGLPKEDRTYEDAIAFGWLRMSDHSDGIANVRRHVSTFGDVFVHATFDMCASVYDPLFENGNHILSVVTAGHAPAIK